MTEPVLWQHLVRVCELQYGRTRSERWCAKLKRHRDSPFDDDQVWRMLKEWERPWRQWRSDLGEGCWLFLYGGFARGRLHPDSDLDVWVEAAHAPVHRRLLLGPPAPKPVSPYFPAPGWAWLERGLAGPRMLPESSLLDSYRRRLILMGAEFRGDNLIRGPRITAETNFWNEPWFRVAPVRRIKTVSGTESE